MLANLAISVIAEVNADAADAAASDGGAPLHHRPGALLPAHARGQRRDRPPAARCSPCARLSILFEQLHSSRSLSLPLLQGQLADHTFA